MEHCGLQAGFRAMADSVPALIWTTGIDGGCTFLNRHWTEFTGRPLERELGHGWTQSVHPDDLDRCLADFGGAIERREPFETEYRLRRADGAWRWILLRGVPLHENGAFAGFIGGGLDLTERREAEEALQESRRQLAAAMAAGRMGSFDLDMATGRVTRDRNLENLYGLPPGAAATFDEWAALIHPDDRRRLLDEVARVAAEGGEYLMEHRLVRADGTVRWFERRGHTYTDESGRVAGIRGIVIDITERKVAEHERRNLLDRVTRLQAVTAALAGAGTQEEVLDIMVADGVRALGASAGSVAVLDPAKGALDVARADGYPAQMLEEFRRIDLAASVPLAEAARTGQPVVLRDLRRPPGRYADLVPLAGRGGHAAIAAFPLSIENRVVGAVGLSFGEPQLFDPAQMEFTAALVAQCAQALDRAWSSTAEAEARQAAEEAQARLGLLADASIVLAGSMEYEATLPEVVRMAVPLLGDCCVLDLVGPDDGEEPGVARRVAAAAVDAESAAVLESLPLPAGLEAPAPGDGGQGAVLVVPLEARHRTLGMLAFGRRSPGVFSDADRSLAAQLGTRVAQAVDNAVLYRAERRAHEDAERAAAQLRFLLDVSTTLASPLGREEGLQELARHAVGAICDVCLVDLVERDGSLSRVAAVGRDPALQRAADALRRLSPGDPQSRLPAAVAIRLRQTQLCEEITDERLQSISIGDSHLDIARRIQPVSYLAVPLVGLDAVLGAVTLITTTASGRRYGSDDRILAEDMASRVAMGLESASMHEDMRRVAQTLQASLLPSLPPAIPGLEVGTRYVAAEEGAVVGGDFFDVFSVAPDAWAVVVGDVCGQGVEAATVTGLARHTVRSSALEHDSPSTVLTHLNDVLLGVGHGPVPDADPRFCTVCLTRVRLTRCGAAVTLALGGHPLPYILGSDGTVRQAGRPGSLLGVVDTPDLVDEHYEMGPGDALVLYTDGITERHHGTTFFGESGLEETLASVAGLTAEEIAGAVEQAARRFVAGEPADDMAVVVVRVPPR